MIFQEPMTSLNPVMKCGRQVAEIIRYHLKESRRKARAMTLDLFEEVELPRPSDIYNSYPHEISGGQKQRVMIAMAIACRPSLLIADEPTTALDVTVQNKIISLIRKLQKRYGMSVILISHDLGVISEIADDVVVMKDGRIVERGSSESVFNSPGHPYTRGLLECRPKTHTRLTKLPTISDFLSDQPVNIEIEAQQEVQKRLTKLKEKEPVLEVRHLKTWFSPKTGLFSKKRTVIRAVDDVSFVVYPGETLGLVGESGCGKTTLGRTIIRLVDSAGGTAVYKGTDILSGKLADKELRRSMQIVFQDPYASLNPRISVGDAASEPMLVHKLLTTKKERRNKVLQLLEKVGLSEKYYHRYPHELSGGQRQRIGIARALAVSPDFIICDESVSALDVSVQAQVLNLLNELKKEFGFTMIFISHDLAVVKHMSDRILIMKEGKIVEANDADLIFASPEQEYTRQLINSIPGNI
jgi:peptide/nickel transport system ATP-binding protein